jgi:hypothetical protein
METTTLLMQREILHIYIGMYKQMYLPQMATTLMDNPEFKQRMEDMMKNETLMKEYAKIGEQVWYSHVSTYVFMYAYKHAGGMRLSRDCVVPLQTSAHMQANAIIKEAKNMYVKFCVNEYTCMCVCEYILRKTRV